jgi:hypothetical protein
MSHVLACALCDPNSSNGLNGFGNVLVDIGVGFIILCCVIGLVRYVLGQLGVKAVKNDPVTPPWVREAVTGQRTPAYTAPVRAVTPSGTAVRQPRCCAAGHQVPEQAVAHAASIKSRIETTGR